MASLEVNLGSHNRDSSNDWGIVEAFLFTLDNVLGFTHRESKFNDNKFENAHIDTDALFLYCNEEFS